MSATSVRSPNNPILITAGIALLLMAIAIMKGAPWDNYRIPVAVIAIPALEYVIFAIALLYVGLRRSPFAGATATVIATFILFGLVLKFVPLAFGGSVHVTWLTAANLAIVVAVLGPLVFPWSPSNKPALLWLGLTFGALALVTGAAILLARV